MLKVQFYLFFSRIISIFDVGLPGRRRWTAASDMIIIYINIMLKIYFYLHISNIIIIFRKYLKIGDIVMITFIIVCVVIMVIDEAIKKHGDLETMIQKLKETKE